MIIMEGCEMRYCYLIHKSYLAVTHYKYLTTFCLTYLGISRSIRQKIKRADDCFFVQKRL